MSSTHCPDSIVRDHVAATLARLSSVPAATLEESLLVRGGHYCGRRFRVGDVSAVWFVEELEIKYYGPEGGLLHKEELHQDASRRAA